MNKDGKHLLVARIELHNWVVHLYDHACYLTQSTFQGIEWECAYIRFFIFVSRCTISMFNKICVVQYIRFLFPIVGL